MRKLDRIATDPEICMGQPTIKGMRITVSAVLKLLAAGKTQDDVLKAYPELDHEDVHQALQFAAWTVSEHISPTPAA